MKYLVAGNAVASILVQLLWSVHSLLSNSPERLRARSRQILANEAP